MKRLVEAETEWIAFLDETSELGEKRGPLLLQLPPSFAFDASVADIFFDLARRSFDGDLVIEPRNASWFTPEVDTLLRSYAISRVYADPSPNGWHIGLRAFADLTYLRLHGSPKVYFSDYRGDRLHEIAEFLANAGGRRWVIFDNTASGAAAGNALQLASLLTQGCAGCSDDARLLAGTSQ